MKKPTRITSVDRAAALVIVLAFTVLITFAIVAYFSQTTTSRQLSSSSASQNSAGIIARDALDTIIGDLKQEITATTNSLGPPAVPARIGTNVNEPNLTKRSVQAQACYTGGPIRASTGSGTPSSNSTTTPSLNGRLVSPARWNKSYLLARPAGADPTDTTPDANFAAPDWIVVTRGAAGLRPGGATISTADLPNLANAKPTNVDGTLNTQFAVGRFAYQIFDEGGLIDINASGYPSPLSVAQVGRKGSTALADLSVLGISNGSPNQIDRIVGWKLYATTQPGRNQVPAPLNPSLYNYDFTQNNAATTFFNYIFAQTNGFLTINTTAPVAGSTDQMFLSRQQLIQYRRGAGFTDTALQYLGTFSRELNRPSWAPTLNATDMGAATNGVGGIYAYKDNAATSTAINRNLTTVRVTSSFVRADGTTAVVGEPLLKTRFPLTRLNTLTPSSTTALRDFGLTWDAANNRWTYSHGSPSRIFRLDEVVAANREPDFFEILKSVILSGSVGLGSGAANTFVAAEAKYYNNVGNASGDYQIMQIGANIIDAWDAADINVPTFINFAGNELAGIENVPYLDKLVLSFRFTNNGQGDLFYCWLVPSLWNPHQNAASAPANQDVRFAMTSGSMNALVQNKNSTLFVSPPIPNSAPYPYIEVKANAFLTPNPPIPSPASSPAPSNENGSPAKVGQVSPTNQGQGYYDGLYFGSYTDTSGDGKNSWKNADEVYPYFAPGTNFEMQVNINGTWKAYQSWKSCNNGSQGGALIESTGAKKNRWKSSTGFKDPELVALDPRTVRFGVWASRANAAGNNDTDPDYDIGAEDTMDQNLTGLESISAMKPQPAATFPTTGKTYLYSTNGTSGDQYADLDGVTRRGDWATISSGLTKTTIMYGSAQSTPPGGTFKDRPQILSAPFQSVAELGQVFRDQPWKTLAFTIANSGDAGLLDAFTLQDVPMTAGRTSLNTRQATGLTAIISQATRGIPGTNAISPANVTTIANRIVSLTSTTPMINKSEIVNTLMQDATLNTIWNTSSTTNPWNKEARECVIRAVSDATQTRTWNLMIDVIAQAGRYPASATGLANFLVEGEKRYWLHVAIDRFTGEVIDQQLEAVYE